MGGEQDPTRVGAEWFDHPGNKIRAQDFGLEKAWIETLMSPALIINEAHVRHNVETMIKKVGGADRWRPHLKTTKMKWVWKILLEAGVRNFKVATTKEAEVMIQLVNEMKSFKDTVDVLVAYPLVGPNLGALVRVSQTPGARQVKLSVLVECEEALDEAEYLKDLKDLNCGIGVFIDINPGMDRTGHPIGEPNEDGSLTVQGYQGFLKLIERARSMGLFRGVHYYEGHISECLAGSGITEGEFKAKLKARKERCFKNYEELRKILCACFMTYIQSHGMTNEFVEFMSGNTDVVLVPEVITSGTPGFTHALEYDLVNDLWKKIMEASAIIPGLNVKPENLIGVHRVSPGTVVFHDWRGERQNPGLGLKPAAVIMARVVSNPREGVVTLDCGSKSIAAEAGDPAGYVIGYPELAAMSCSEEHLPCSIVKEEFRMPTGGEVWSCTEENLPGFIAKLKRQEEFRMRRGEVCFVVPEHICPTVNLADEVVVYDEVSGEIRFEKVDARGHHLRLDDINV